MNKFLKTIAVSLAALMVAGAVQFITPSCNINAAEPLYGEDWEYTVDSEGTTWFILDSANYKKIKGVEDSGVSLPDSTFRPEGYEGDMYFKLDTYYNVYAPLNMSSGTVTIDLNGKGINLGCGEGALNLNAAGKYNFINTSESPAYIGCSSSNIFDRDGNGGLISVATGATLTIDNVDLKNGSAKNGGAISAETGANVTLSNCSITNCYTTGYGSAIYVGISANLYMTNVTITGNYCESSTASGAVYTAGNTTELNGKMVISGNSNTWSDIPNLVIAGSSPVSVNSNFSGTDVILSCPVMEADKFVLKATGCGLSGYTCDDSAHYYIDEKGFIREVVDYGTAKLDGMKLVLDGYSVKIFFYISLEGVKSDDWEIYINSVKTSCVDGDEEDQYIVKKEIDYSHLTDKINIEVKFDNGVDIFEKPDVPITAQSYAVAILESSNYSADAKAVAKAMLNYGTYAEKYFDPNVQSPANSVLSAEMQAEAFLPESEYKLLTSSMEITETTADVQYYGSSIVLLNDGTIKLKHYIKVADGFETELVSNRGSFDRNANPKFYSLLSSSNAIFELDKAQAFTILDRDGNEYVTISYSGLDYIYLAYNYGSPELQEYVKALYKYHTVLKSVGGGVL